jgi:hypothetical protein
MKKKILNIESNRKEREREKKLLKENPSTCEKFMLCVYMHAIDLILLFYYIFVYKESAHARFNLNRFKNGYVLQ